MVHHLTVFTPECLKWEELLAFISEKVDGHDDTGLLIMNHEDLNILKHGMITYVFKTIDDIGSRLSSIHHVYKVISQFDLP